MRCGKNTGQLASLSRGSSQGASMALAAALKRPRDFCRGHRIERVVLFGDVAGECGFGGGSEGFYVARDALIRSSPLPKPAPPETCSLPLGLDLLYKEYDMPHAIAEPCFRGFGRLAAGAAGHPLENSGKQGLDPRWREPVAEKRLRVGGGRALPSGEKALRPLRSARDA